jgi:hypothetical protein
VLLLFWPEILFFAQVIFVFCFCYYSYCYVVFTFIRVGLLPFYVFFK